MGIRGVLRLGTVTAVGIVEAGRANVPETDAREDRVDLDRDRGRDLEGTGRVPERKIAKRTKNAKRRRNGTRKEKKEGCRRLEKTISAVNKKKTSKTVECFNLLAFL